MTRPRLFVQATERGTAVSYDGRRYVLTPWPVPNLLAPTGLRRRCSWPKTSGATPRPRTKENQQ